MDPRELRRFVHGLAWGAAASVVGAVVTLLAMAVQLWPTTRPLSVMVTALVSQEYLGRSPSLPVMYLVASLVQLAYGAFCGGLLALVSEPVTVPSALGMGALRWFFTQVVVLSALGWGDFALFHRPSIALVTMLPQLGYALSLGWLMRQEDLGREPIWLHRRQWHLARIPHRGRR
jgi:hypothetical protein